MELTGEKTIPATRERTWAALNDPEVLKACIAGCETLERDGDDGMRAVVAMTVGPVSARFNCKLTLSDIVPPERYTLHFEAQAGAAGFGKGSAAVSLVEAGPSATTLSYTARAQVGGKLAQIGSRLVDATAAKVTADFFKAFEARLSDEAAAAAPASSPAPEAAGTALAVPAPAGSDKTEPAESLATLWWVVAATVALVVLYFALR